MGNKSGGFILNHDVPLHLEAETMVWQDVWTMAMIQLQCAQMKVQNMEGGDNGNQEV